MKALVTGGAGFIGSHISEALCRKGAEVVVLDNLATGNPSNLDWKKQGDKIDLVEGDIGDQALLAQLMPGIDWVFHQGAVASVPASVAAPLVSNAINLDGTLNVLVAARDAGVKRLMFASSSAIYGNADVPEKHESLPVQPLSPYALQKYGGERYCQLFHQLYGFEAVALRYFNIFGPRQSFDSPYSGVIAKFCTFMLEGKPPVIFGDGSQARDFTFVDNAVSANLLAAEAPADRAAGKVFNVAAGHSIDLIRLVKDINEQTGQQLQPRFEPARAGDVLHSLADISAARSCLNYEVKVAWEEGLRQTLEFYRQEAKKI